MPTLEDLAEENPNITQQAAEWRAARAANGEDPDDWHAFREHLQAIGAPDPGDDEADDFHGA
jgi:hypothetical protein